MIAPSAKASSSLRERKKAQTRQSLINAAVDLCLMQGFEQTTVEQICDEVEISPRTFSRYFASKDAVFIAVLDDLADEIVAELMGQPPDLGPMESLRAAHMSVLTRVSRGPLSGLTTDRIVLILRIVYSSDTLRQSAIEYRSRPAMDLLAGHMGVPVDDPSLQLAVALFATTIVSACKDLVADDPDVELGPDAVMERLEKALSTMAQFTSELQLP